MTDVLKALMLASVKIGGPKPGSGYLVARNRVATCHHVINLWLPDEKYEVGIGYPDPILRQARVIKADEQTDCAILGFEPPVEVTPLPFAEELDIQASWEGYGFPHAAKGVGIPFTGEILIPQTKDEKGHAVILLYSPQAGSGAATPLHGFSGSPVLVEGALVGQMARVIGDPDDAKRPAFGQIFATPIKYVEALLDVKPEKRVIRPAKLARTSGFIEEMQKSGAQQVRALDVPKDVTLRTARLLISQNRPKLALELLRAREPETLEAQQILALALAKAGETDESIDLLKRLVAQGASDHETLGLLAGRYKDKWRDKDDRAALWASYETYRKVFDQTGESFNGINAAATALYCGEAAESAVLAERVGRALEGKDNLTHWEMATLGESWLLRNKLDRAREWYQKAVAEKPDFYHDIAVMRRQARINLKHLGKPTDALDDVLPVPGVLAFAGHMVDDDDRPMPRFPKAKISAVRLAIREQLEQLGFVQGFGTAAKGSDILFLSEMVKRNVRPIVVMPFLEADFRRISVGEEWGPRLDNIRSQLEIVILKSETPTADQLPAAFGESNRRIQRMAMEHAKGLDEKPNLLVVWDRKRKGDGPGGTADAVDLWEYEGYKPIVIDINTLKAS